MILPDQINLAEIAFLAFQADEELEIQSRIVKARELEAGYFDPTLAAELQEKALLGGVAADIEGVNMPSVALNTVASRVSLQAVTTTDENQTKWLQQISEANKLLKLQRSLHKAAVRDSQAFLALEYDRYKARPWAEGERGLPRFYVHERYTSPDATYGDTVGSGEGCRAFYRNNDPDQDLEMIAKRWTETIYENNEPVTRQRMTLYIAEQFENAARVEKYVMDDNGEWAQHSDQVRDESGAVTDEPWPIWWTDTGEQTGASLPLPIFVFQSGDDEPAFKRAWGLQAGMDQMWASMLSGGTLSGHPLLVALGFMPTTDGKEVADDKSNQMVSAPRQIIGTTKSKTEADMKQIPPADPRSIIDVMDRIAVYYALVTRLPMNNFTTSVKQVQSGDTLRQGESELKASANELIAMFEPEWLAVFRLARKLDNFYGGGNWDESLAIAALWAPMELVSQEVKKDEVEAKLAAGVPGEKIQADVFGYSEEEIAQNRAQNGAGQNGAGEPETAVSEAGGEA